jgi:hypothetical protein
MIEVTDIYVAFYKIACILWESGEMRDRPDAKNELGPPFFIIVDGLELEFFYAACARRVAKQTGIRLPYEKVREILRLHDASGVPLDGLNFLYGSDGFDHGAPGDETIKPWIVTGMSVPRPLETTRVYAYVGPDMRIDGKTLDTFDPPPWRPCGF